MESLVVAVQVFRLSFGPKSFVVVSDAEVARHLLMSNAANYSKGILSEILDFVMGSGAQSVPLFCILGSAGGLVGCIPVTMLCTCFTAPCA